MPGSKATAFRAQPHCILHIKQPPFVTTGVHAIEDANGIHGWIGQCAFSASLHFSKYYNCVLMQQKKDGDWINIQMEPPHTCMFR